MHYLIKSCCRKEVQQGKSDYIAINKIIFDVSVYHISGASLPVQSLFPVSIYNFRYRTTFGRSMAGWCLTVHTAQIGYLTMPWSFQIYNLGPGTNGKRVTHGICVSKNSGP